MLSYLPLNVSRLIKLTSAFVWLVSLVLLFNFPAPAAPGDFDSSFGTNGILGFSVPHQFHDLALQPDGKILAIGYTRIGAPGYPSYPASFMRFNADGSIDASFGSGGRVSPQVGTNIVEKAAAFALQPDGKIVLAGVFKTDSTSPYRLVVFRYLANGQLDSSFGSGGLVTLAQNALQAANEVLIQPDGKLLVCGTLYVSLSSPTNSALWRFNPDGTPDTGFGNGGVVAPGSGEPTLNHYPGALLLQPGGKILIVGSGDSGFFIIRYHPNGTLDTSFGNGGRVITTIQNGSGASDAAFQPDGKIVLAGSARDGFASTTNMALARYSADGELDPSFGTGGTVVTNIGVGLSSYVSAMVIQTNGKIIIGGYRNLPFYENAAMLAGFNPSGTLDKSFGVGGYIFQQYYSTGQAVTYNMALQPDGKLVTVGRGFYDKYSAYATLMRHRLNGARESDFDGDRKSDVSIFRPNAEAEWYWLNSSNNESSGIQFGIATDKPAPADFDGDGKTDVSVFREGDWYRLNSSDNSFLAVHFGQAGDVPVPADFDGDNRADLAVYRQGDWYILNSSDDSFRADQFGIASDKPIIGDFDGDGKTDLAVYRDGVWYVQQSCDGFFGAQFGINTDKPVAADYDGDGKTDLAVYRPSDGTWYLQRSHLGFTAAQFGISTDLAIPADYDNDGKADIAVYRDGDWYLQQSTAGFKTVRFGAANDVPVPSALLP
jgi:uncharacterized delta-60 repeat protein